jgi:hypothetical protein
MERVGLDHHTLEIQLAKQLPQSARSWFSPVA